MMQSSKPAIRKKLQKKAVVFTQEDNLNEQDIYAVLSEAKKLNAEQLHIGNPTPMQRPEPPEPSVDSNTSTCQSCVFFPSRTRASSPSKTSVGSDSAFAF